jgi:hypothetical protein
MTLQHEIFERQSILSMADGSDDAQHGTCFINKIEDDNTTTDYDTDEVK